MVDTLANNDVSGCLQFGRYLSTRCQQPQHLGMKRQISRGDKIGLPHNILGAVQRAERSTGFPNTRHDGSDIPRIHSRVEGDVDTPLAQQSVVDAISGPAKAAGSLVKARETD